MLESLNSVHDLRKIPVSELPRLAAEIRKYMIDVVSKNGGHLAPSLGVVELTIAMHYVFNTPADRIVWDVGHQTYAHKIITGRKNEFLSLRQFEGISGFPKSCESEFDCYDTGHSSTSLSLALGEAVARDLSKKKHKVIAVIGDGALTGGLSFEALNHIGHLQKDMIIILNDNEHSISRNVGALSRYLTELISGAAYNSFTRSLKKFFRKIPFGGKHLPYFFDRLRMGVKNLLVPANFFEDFGIRYFGPVDGHDVENLVRIFSRIRTINSGPKVIHVITKKGYGYKPAEKEPVRFHGTLPFDIDTGKPYAVSKLSFSAVAGKTLCSVAEKDKRIIAITAAMATGTGLDDFAKKFPSRFFDVGIAEQHAVTLSAALAKNGYKPFFAVYSSFMQRAYDQLIHDVATMNLPAVFLIDRAGIVGEDGETHHGLFDVSYIRNIPNFELLIPMDGKDLRDMINYASKATNPVAIRYPRGYCGNESIDFGVFESDDFSLPVKTGKGNDCLIISAGDMKTVSSEAAHLLENNGVRVSTCLVRSLKSLESAKLRKEIEKTSAAFFVENAYMQGGMGEYLTASLEPHLRQKIIGCFAYPRRFIEHGSSDHLFEKYHLAPGIIAAEIQKAIRNK